MNVFLLTSVPIIPPWDQGDKNLVYSLTTALPYIKFRVLTAQRGAQPAGDNLELEPRFRTCTPSLWQKVSVYSWLFFMSLQQSSSDHNHGKTLSGQMKHLSRLPPPDIYHLIYRPLQLSSHLFRLLPELRRRPTLHTIPATADEHSLDKKLFFADRLVVTSLYGRQRLQKEGLRNIIHIPSGINIQQWVALQHQTGKYKAMLDLTGSPVVLFPGHYGSGQGSEVVLDAIPRILQVVPQTRFIFACRLRSSADREKEMAVRQRIQALGLTRAVLFLNTVSNMETIIGASDLVVLPLSSMRDKVDIPTTLLEAIAAGKPIVISDIPPMNELVHLSQEAGLPAGLAVPSNDGPAFAQAVLQLLSDAGLRQHLGSNGIEIACRHFDIHKIAKAYEKLYREMLHE